LDITDRKQIASKPAEELFRRSEHRYRVVFDVDLSGDYVATAEGQVLLCGQAFVKILSRFLGLQIKNMP
jgi:PAS domain-containing protein